MTTDEEARTQVEVTAGAQREALDGVLAIPWSETIHPETGFERYTYIGSQASDILGYRPEELRDEPKHFPGWCTRTIDLGSNGWCSAPMRRACGTTPIGSCVATARSGGSTRSGGARRLPA